MDSDPITDLEEVMEDVQECCTDSEADVLFRGCVIHIQFGNPPPPQNILFLKEKEHFLIMFA